MTPNSTEERAALVNDLAVKITEHAIMELDADEENTLQIEAFGNAVEREILADLPALTRTDNDVSGLVEALDGCDAIESGPNGRGGMRVVAHFPQPSTEGVLFALLNEALAKHRQSNGGAA